MTTAPLTSIRTQGDSIEIVNQLVLPHKVEWIPIKSIDDAYDAIKTMKIRGAPAIASLAALSISSHLSNALEPSSGQCYTFFGGPLALKEYLQPKLDYLATARPTAVNLGAAVKRLTKVLDAGVAEDKNAYDIAYELVAEGRAVADEDVGRNRRMGEVGAAP